MLLKVGKAVTSNHLDISYVWKALVLTGYVWLEFECTFPMLSSPAVKCSSPVQNVLVTSDKRICLQCDTVFGGETIFFASWFRTLQKGTETREKFLKKTSF